MAQSRVFRICLVVWCGLFFAIPMQAFAQDADPDNCLDVRNSVTAPCLSARAPGNWIKRALGGGNDITEPEPEPFDVRKEVILDVLTVLFDTIDQFIAPGVYLYHVQTRQGDEKLGRFLVIK